MTVASAERWHSASSNMIGALRRWVGEDEWPAHLRSILDGVLAYGFPMILLRGNGLVQIYNDDYAAIMREKHPAG